MNPARSNWRNLVFIGQSGQIYLPIAILKDSGNCQKKSVMEINFTGDTGVYAEPSHIFNKHLNDQTHSTNCLSVFDHFVGLALKGLRYNFLR